TQRRRPRTDREGDLDAPPSLQHSDVGAAQRDEARRWHRRGRGGCLIGRRDRGRRRGIARGALFDRKAGTWLGHRLEKTTAEAKAPLPRALGAVNGGDEGGLGRGGGGVPLGGV